MLQIFYYVYGTIFKYIIIETHETFWNEYNDYTVFKI